jgi:hypothetical protein
MMLKGEKYEKNRKYILPFRRAHSTKLIRQYLMKYSYFAINANAKKVFVENQRDENSIKDKIILCARRLSIDIFDKMLCQIAIDS